MNIFFIPPIRYVALLPTQKSRTTRELCAHAGVPCRASGAWTERRIQIAYSGTIKISAEPGDWGVVRIEVPVKGVKKRSQMALYILAYGLHDLVAKQSIIGAAWAVVKAPRGRPSRGCALSSRDRQRRFRAKQSIA